MNHTMSNFFHEFAAAAQAMEELPIVKARLDESRKIVDEYAENIQRLELKLIDRANEIDALNQRIRSLEVERDDAQFQALEEQDRTSAFKRFVESIFGQAGNLLQASAPAPEVKAQPMMADDPNLVDHSSEVVFSVPSEAHIDGPMTGHAPQDQSATDPTGAPIQSSTESPIGEAVGSTNAEPAVSTSTEGSESAVDPTTASTQTSSDSPTLDSSASDAASSSTSADATVGESAADPTPATAPSSESGLSGLTESAKQPKYAGKLYKDIDYYVPLSHWLADGGTEADYYAR